MLKNFILTLTGPDRIGIVDRVTGLLFERGGNVEASRMARLGGEFAILMLVTLPDDRLGGLDSELDRLAEEGFKAAVSPAQQPRGEQYAGWIPFRIEVEGADHEGIIHEVSHYLSEKGVNIESVDAETTAAPVSGSPLFSMTAHVVIPPSLADEDWGAGLSTIADRMNLEIRVIPDADA